MLIVVPKVHHQEKLVLCCEFAEGTLLGLEVWDISIEWDINDGGNEKLTLYWEVQLHFLSHNAMVDDVF